MFWPVSAALVANVMGATAGTGFTTALATRSAVGQEAANDSTDGGVAGAIGAVEVKIADPEYGGD